MTNAALLAIDFINDIVNEKGKIPSCATFVKEHNVIQSANTAIQAAREIGMKIIFIKVGFSSEYHELPKNSPVFGGAAAKEALKLGDWGTEFHQDLNYHPSDATIIKPRISPFYATQLEAFLHAANIETLFIAGVSTNNAVQATARDAHDRDYRVIILEDACGAKNKETHENTLMLLKDFAVISSVSEIRSLA
jgi:ureidoacrylate peracid hydrolase